MRRALFCGALVLLVPAGARAEAPRKGGPALSLVVGVERRYDDNILQLTRHNLDRLAENPGSSRFRIESPDDDIHAFRGLLRWRLRPLPRRETKLEAQADAYAYLRNDVKDWQQYALGVTQELTASQRHLATLEFWGRRLPEFYLGEYTDADDSFAAGRRIRRSMTYAQTALGARFRQEVGRGRLEFGAGYERLHRNYEAHFNERDNDNDQWRVTLAGRPLRRSGLTVGLVALVGRLDARGDLPGSEIKDVDTSYDHRGLGVTFALPWGRRGWRGRADASWLPERRAYTTADPYDVSRHGRVNHRRETTVRLTQHAWGPFDLVGSYYRLTSDARFPAGVAISDYDTDFAQTRWGLFLRGRWELAGR